MVIELAKPHNVYMDESRQDRYGVPIFSVTAYVSTFEAFILLEKEWRQALAHKGYEVFHATDFMARYDLAADWPNEQRNDFIDRLAYIASEHTTFGLACSIREDDYNQSFREIPELLNHWKDPFGFCLYTCLTMLLHLEQTSRATLQKPLYVLFDNKPEFEGTAHRIFNDLRQANDPRGAILGDFGFGKKDNIPVLQATDLLAYESTRQLNERDHRGVAIEMHRVVQILTRKQNVLIAPITAELLEEFGRFAKEARALTQERDRSKGS